MLDFNSNKKYNLVDGAWGGAVDLAAKATLAEIKQDLDAFVGQKICLRAVKGRRQVVEKVGLLEKTYPYVFVVKVEGEKGPSRRVSFSYTDILTRSVQWTPWDEEQVKEVKGA